MEWQSAMRWNAAELWSQNVALEYYGKRLLEMVAGNIISHQYKAGQFTDDTSQVHRLSGRLNRNRFYPNSQSIATHFRSLAEKVHAFENNILGPTSKVALKLFQEGKC